MVDPELRPTSKRQLFLQVASQIIRREGIRHLTLDAVAHEAQVSKGGLLYHFPSKEALFEGVIQYLFDRFGQRLERELTQAPDPIGTPGRWLRAYLRATFDADNLEYELSAVIAIAIAEDPALMKLIQIAFEQLWRLSEQDGLPFEVATMIRLATDGLWFSEALNMKPLDANHRQDFLNYLIKMTQLT